MNTKPEGSHCCFKQSQWLLVCHLWPWQRSLPHHHRLYFLLLCPIDQYHKPKRRLKFHKVDWADLTASCHQKGQGSHPPHNLPIQLTNTGKEKKNKTKHTNKIKVSILNFLLRGQIQRPEDEDLRLGTEKRTTRCTSTLLGHFQLIWLQSCPEGWAAFPNSLSSAAISQSPISLSRD